MSRFSTDKKYQLRKGLLCLAILFCLGVGQRAYAVTPTSVPTFHCISLYWSPAGGAATRNVLVKYRAVGTDQWYHGLAMRYMPISSTTRVKSDYRGSIVNLTPNTSYEVNLQLEDGTEQENLIVKTLKEEFPIAATVEITQDITTPLNITGSGTETGYILYNGNGKTIDLNNLENNGINIDANYIIIRNFRIINTRQNGIKIGANHHIVIENCDISKWGDLDTDVNGNGFGTPGRAAIFSSPGNNQPGVYNLVVQRNKIHHPNYDTNSWSERHRTADNHPQGPQPLYIWESKGNNIIRYNEFWSDADHYFNDVIGGGSNSGASGFPGEDSDIYGNYIANSHDDGIEAEGGNQNVRIWSNFIEQTYVSIANAATRIGPLYVWQNVVGQGRVYGVKMGFAGGIENMTGHQYFFNNTYLQPNNEGTGGLGTSGSNSRDIKHFMGRNNILHGRTGRVLSISTKSSNNDNSFDYDLLSGSYPAGHEANGIKGIPAYSAQHGFDFATKTGNFQLDPASAGFDKGQPLPNFADYFNGVKPDIGAHEAGTPDLVFGVNANFVPRTPNHLVSQTPPFALAEKNSNQYLETMGSGSTPSSTTNPNATTPAILAAYNGWDNKAAPNQWVYSGNTPVSTGSTSPAGGSNIILQAPFANRAFQIANINTSTFTDPQLSFYFYKSVDAADGSEVKFHYSTNGVDFTTLDIPAQPTTAGSAGWRLVTFSNLPADSSLTIKFTKAAANAAATYRIDQIRFVPVKRAQTITFNPLPAKTYGDGNFAPTATTTSGLELTYSSSDTTVASIEDDTIYIVGAGVTNITASQAGDGMYLPAASVVQQLTVNKASQTISFGAITPKNASETVALAATSTAGLAVSFRVVSGPGYLSGNTLLFSGEGQVVVAATQAGNENYSAAAPVEQTILVYADDEKKDGIKLIVYPNPTNGPLKVKLENKKDKDYTFTIYDGQGNPLTASVLPKSHKMFEVDFDLRQAANGYYYLHVWDGSEVIVRKIEKRQ